MTQKIKGWAISTGPNDELIFIYYLKNNQKRQAPLSECHIEPARLESGPSLLEIKGKSVRTKIEKAVTYGEHRTVVWYPENDKPYILKSKNIKIHPCPNYGENSPHEYFLEIAQARLDQGNGEEKTIRENVLRQMGKIISSTETALHAYLTGTNASRADTLELIYPFGVNESQITATEKAFTSQVSIIEGPPGTGKTQTILNIIANILIRKKTVAILSNNNAAVENVYEKLAKENLDYLVAKLGSTDKKEIFFASQKDRPSETVPSDKNVHSILPKLKKHLSAQNQAAVLKNEINELSIENEYLQKWRTEHLIEDSRTISTHKYSTKQMAELMAYLHYLHEKTISVSDRFRLFFNFGIIRTKNINTSSKRNALFYSLQSAYYRKLIQEKNEALVIRQKILAENNVQHLMQELTAASIAHLKNYLSKISFPKEAFTLDNYRRRFNEFVERYPIIGSSTHSIINSLATGTVLDYVIIDEASQQDIVPGILGMACAKNIIIVGDRKQLPHIPSQTGLKAPKDAYDCEKFSLLDSVIQLFKDTVPVTLLREHYRCHPKIIQFCNKQFYNNKLIPMTQDNGEDALSLVVTAKGNHARNNSNLRELDSLEVLSWDPERKTGFIAPFRNQVSLARSRLPKGFIKSTIHQFQGRECDEIVFSTVLDKKKENQKKLNFVDDPHLVNVAVSRAKKRFTLVTGDHVFANSSHISALIRHIEYYANPEEIHHSPIVSAFDLLYDEYDVSLKKLNSLLRKEDSKFKSEQIAEQLLRQILAIEKYGILMFHTQVLLNQVVSSKNSEFTEREVEYMQNRASCDFVIYFRVGKTPAGIIEVDSSFHNNMKQRERDSLKDSILQKSNLPILRLKTIESHIEEKISNFFDRILED